MFAKYKVFLLAVLALLLTLSATMSAQSRPHKQIDPMTTADTSQLERQRIIVSRVVRDNFGYVKLEGHTSDLYYLQKIVDKQLISKQDTYDLQALGVVLGDVMAKNLSLKWVVVEDRYGRNRALQFENSDNLFFPITMISRRVISGMEVDVRALYKETEQTVKALTYRRSQYRALPSS